MSRRAKFAVVAGVDWRACRRCQFFGAVEAGTCQPVKAKGKGKNIAEATTLAQVDLAQKAAAIRGKVTQTSTNCVPGPNERRLQDPGGRLPEIV